MMSKYTDYNFQPFCRTPLQILALQNRHQFKRNYSAFIKRKSAIGQAHTGTGKHIVFNSNCSTY